MKRTFTHKPVIPFGYTGIDFNGWQDWLKKQREKIDKPCKTVQEAKVVKLKSA